MTQIEKNGLMLAAFAFASYPTAVHKLEAGDRMVMYTDGILEASNAAGDFFGHEALCDLLKRTRAFSPAMAADAIVASVRQWSGKQDDDLTVLICDYTPRIDECGTALPLVASRWAREIGLPAVRQNYGPGLAREPRRCSARSCPV